MLSSQDSAVRTSAFVTSVTTVDVYFYTTSHSLSQDQDFPELIYDFKPVLNYTIKAASASNYSMELNLDLLDSVQAELNPVLTNFTLQAGESSHRIYGVDCTLGYQPLADILCGSTGPIMMLLLRHPLYFSFHSYLYISPPPLTLLLNHHHRRRSPSVSFLFIFFFVFFFLSPSSFLFPSFLSFSLS